MHYGTTLGFSLFSLVVLSGCLFTSPVESDSQGRHVEPVVANNANDHPEPAGVWKSRASVAGWTAWVARFDQLPPEQFEWLLRWEPTTEGGFLVTSGFLFGSLVNGRFDVSSHDAVTHASVETETQGLTVRRGIDEGPWFLAFIVEPHDAQGLLELTVKWNDGPVHDWGVRIYNQTGLKSTLPFTLTRDVTLDLNLEMADYQAIHLALPCVRDSSAPEAKLDVRLGNEGPGAYRMQGQRENGILRSWTAYAGFWTYAEATALTYVEYDGPGSISAVVLRSNVDTQALLAPEIGHPITIASSAHICQRTGPSQPG